MPIAGQNHFQRGILLLVILSILQKEDMYGYQLVQEVSSQSKGKIITQEGSLYPVLYKLCEQKYVTSREVLVGKKMKRVLYHIEPSGLEYLSQLTGEYKTITEGVFDILEHN